MNEYATSKTAIAVGIISTFCLGVFSHSASASGANTSGNNQWLPTADINLTTREFGLFDGSDSASIKAIDGSAAVRPVDGIRAIDGSASSTPRAIDGSAAVRPVDETRAIDGSASSTPRAIDGSAAVRPVDGIRAIDGSAAVRPVDGIRAIDGSAAVRPVDGIRAIDGSAAVRPVDGIRAIDGSAAVRPVDGIRAIDGSASSTPRAIDGSAAVRPVDETRAIDGSASSTPRAIDGSAAVRPVDGIRAIDGSASSTPRAIDGSAAINQVSGARAIDGSASSVDTLMEMVTLAKGEIQSINSAFVAILGEQINAESLMNAIASELPIKNRLGQVVRVFGYVNSHTGANTITGVKWHPEQYVPGSSMVTVTGVVRLSGNKSGEIVVGSTAVDVTPLLHSLSISEIQNGIIVTIVGTQPSRSGPVLAEHFYFQ